MDPAYPPQRPLLATHSRRSAVLARSHVVATSQPLATQIGHQILSQFPDANAADAAIAIAAALNVLEPGSCGIGGDMFCLYYSATDQTVKAINGSGRSPAALTLELARKLHPDARDRLPASSPHAITVPGAVMGWHDTYHRFGSGKVKWAELLAPAIDLAQHGFPVSRISSAQWVGSEARLKAASPNAAEMLMPGTSKAPLEGEWMQLPNLARTLREVADKGAKDGFYRGRIAEAIVGEVQRLGGVMHLDDLEAHASTFEDPISIEYGPVRLWECAPNGQGLVAILALAILDKAHELGVIPTRPEDLLADHLATASTASPTVPTTYAHLLIQAIGLAFAEGQAHITDPSIVPPADTLAKLLSPTHLTHLASKLSATSRGAAGAGAPFAHTDTVYFSVGDAHGNACSFIFSNYMGFGHGAIPQGCGFTLQNRGCGFVLDATSVNVLGPRKRAYHTIIPGMLTDAASGKLVAAMGVMGGYMQPQGHVQVLMQYLAARECERRVKERAGGKCPVARFGDPQSALDAKRFLIQPEERLDQCEGGVVVPVDVEQGMLSANQLDELRALGHVVREVPLHVISMFGRGQWVGRVHADEATRNRGGPEGWWLGASDGRADGCAFGS
ncbi:gamma-glutamyltranspeptidase, partial [Catenaria anguillulae PL171]